MYLEIAQALLEFVVVLALGDLCLEPGRQAQPLVSFLAYQLPRIRVP